MREISLYMREKNRYHYRMMERRPTWPDRTRQLHHGTQPGLPPLPPEEGEIPDGLGEVDAAFDALDDFELDVLLREALGGRRVAAHAEER